MEIQIKLNNFCVLRSGKAVCCKVKFSTVLEDLEGSQMLVRCIRCLQEALKPRQVRTCNASTKNFEEYTSIMVTGSGIFRYSIIVQRTDIQNKYDMIIYTNITGRLQRDDGNQMINTFHNSYLSASCAMSHVYYQRNIIKLDYTEHTMKSAAKHKKC